MRHVSVVVIGLLAAAMAVAIAPARSARSSAVPSLRVKAIAPLAVAGLGFAPHERVKIDVVSNGARVSRMGTANSAGAFVLTVRVTLGRCAGGTIRARGSAGSIASTKIPRLGCNLE